MPSLAHEGNPKEDEIVISGGSVLSTAQLDIDFLFFGGAPNVPSTSNPNLTVKSTSNCSDVFLWAGQSERTAFDDFHGGKSEHLIGQDFVYFHDSGPNIGAVSDSLKDTTLDLQIHSGPTCYGILWKKVFPLTFPATNIAAGDELLLDVQFAGVVSGTPRAGPCIWIDDATEVDSAQLFALVVDLDASLTQLVRFNNASVKSMDFATILATMVLPNVGDRMDMDMLQFPNSVGSNKIFGAIYPLGSGVPRATVQFLFEDAKPFDGSKARHSKMGVGFVSVGGQKNGIMAFVNKTGGAFPSPFVFIDNSGGT